MKFSPHPYRVRSALHGLSHGLKSVHRTLFTSLRSAVLSSPAYKKERHPNGCLSFLVGEAGLEAGLCQPKHLVERSKDGFFSTPSPTSGRPGRQKPQSQALLLPRPLSKLGRPKLYFEFPIGFDEALEYKKAHGQYLRRNQWQDLTVHVYI